MIWGYPDEASVLPGGRLVLRVSTDAPAFRVEFYRWGAEQVRVGGTGWFAGRAVPHHLPFQDWSRPGTGLRGEDLPAWPAYEVPVPAGWTSGVYVGVLVEGEGGVEGEGDGDGPAGTGGALLDRRDGTLLFVVRGAGAPLLYKVPLFTYHAYDQVDAAGFDPARGVDPGRGEGGWCLYTVPAARHLPVAVPPAVSLHRPGGGTGGTPWDHFNVDPFAPGLRQTFAHWDAPFVGWLERQGYEVDYCTDLDLHREGGALLAGRRLLVSAGHDEYWTAAMRDAVHGFVSAGGNVTFFGGNTCWWRLELDGDLAISRTAFWSALGEPENTLTGVSFRNGGERDRDDHPVPVGFRVQHCDHWVFQGTGLRDGDGLGARADEYVVGYECDGAHFDREPWSRGRPAQPTGEDGTPESFVVLGVGDLVPSGWGFGNRAATLGLFTAPSGGTVFTAATTDWARVLAAGRSPAVEAVTANVLDRLG